MGDFKLMFAPNFNKDGWYNPDARPRKMRMVVSFKINNYDYNDNYIHDNMVVSFFYNYDI